jgi:putative membrane protein
MRPTLAGWPASECHRPPQSCPVSDAYAWNLDPLLLFGLLAWLVVYVVRWRRARAEAGTRGAGAWRLVSFCTGMALLAVALVSPVDTLGDRLLVMHMTQHLILLDLAPIFLILGLTKVILRPVTRRMQRIEAALGPIAHPAFAVVLYAGGTIAWHTAPLYDAALDSPVVHAIEHLTFLSAGLLFWWFLLAPIRMRHRLSGLGPIVYLIATKLMIGFLGIVITFSPDVLYSHYEEVPRMWGLSAIDDQSIGGLIMAIEDSILMIIALFVLFTRMLTESEQEEQRAERYGAA